VDVVDVGIVAVVVVVVDAVVVVSSVVLAVVDEEHDAKTSDAIRRKVSTIQIIPFFN